MRLRRSFRRVTRWVVIDAPLPEIGTWDKIIRSPTLGQFNYRGPDLERLAKGRERIYLDRFWNELSADPKSIKEARLAVGRCDFDAPPQPAHRLFSGL